jgi:dolichol kinase
VESICRGFTPVVLRKIIHVMLSIILILPYTLRELFQTVVYINTSTFYSILSIAVLTLNVLQLKKPLLRSDIKRAMRAGRKLLFDEILRIIPVGKPILQILDDVDDVIRRIEDLIDDQLSRIERRYEKIGGYIGLTYGVLGVTIAYFLFRDYVFYGILALMTVDSTSTIIGGKYGRHLIPFINKSIEGSAAGFIVYYAILIALGVNPLASFIISLATTLTEMFSIEDNLFIPLVTALIAEILNLPVMYTSIM